MGGIDDLIRQMEQDEDDDRLEVQTHATPIEYARSRGIRPQRVYYMLRNNRLSDYSCQCGRRVIEIQEADELFGIKKEPEPEPEEVDDGPELEDGAL